MIFEIEKNSVGSYKITGTEAIVVRLNDNIFLYDVEYKEWSKLISNNSLHGHKELKSILKVNKYPSIINLFNKGIISEN